MLVFARACRVSGVATSVPARKSPHRSVLGGCATLDSDYRRSPAHRCPGPRHFTSSRHLRPTFRRSARAETGRFRLGKGLTFCPSQQGAKERTLSPLPYSRPSHYPLSQGRASLLFVSRNLSDL